LKKKGAVLVEEKPTTKLFTAAPAKEYLQRVQKQMAESFVFLESNLPQTQDSLSGAKVFKLESIEQVNERAEEMILNVQRSIVVDAFPVALSLISEYLEKVAAKKGKNKVSVVVNSYDGKSLKNCVMVKKSMAAETLKIYTDSWLNLVVDGDKYLLAVVKKDDLQLRHGIWSNSPYLSFALYSGMASEMALSAVIEKLQKENLLHVTKDLREKYIIPLMGTAELTNQMPGFKKIMEAQSK
jgi:sugar-specific transcriptional regulator TrmB